MWNLTAVQVREHYCDDASYEEDEGNIYKSKT